MLNYRETLLKPEMQNLSDITLKYLSWTPMSLAIREVSRIQALNILSSKMDLFNVKSILDVGCGDGHWWQNILPEGLDKVHGIDISAKEIDLAKKIIWAKHVDVTADDFKSQIEHKTFDLAIGNCSMEHIYHIDKALKNINDVLNPGGTFVLFVPTPYWAFKGKSVALLEKVSPRLSMMFSGMINGFFQHWHLYHHKIWKALLQSFGFKDVQAFGLGNKRSEFLFRLFLPSAFISFMVKVLTGKYLNHFLYRLTPASHLRNLSGLLNSSLDKDLRPPNADDIFEYILICKK